MVDASSGGTVGGRGIYAARPANHDSRLRKEAPPAAAAADVIDLTHEGDDGDSPGLQTTTELEPSAGNAVAVPNHEAAVEPATPAVTSPGGHEGSSSGGSSGSFNLTGEGDSGSEAVTDVLVTNSQRTPEGPDEQVAVDTHEELAPGGQVQVTNAEPEPGDAETEVAGRADERAQPGSFVAQQERMSTHHPLLGRRICKFFSVDGRTLPFYGTIDGFDPSVRWFHVKYEDGDEEELGPIQVRQLLVKDASDRLAINAAHKNQRRLLQPGREKFKLCSDISFGKEKIKIPVYNEVDDDRSLPDFRYLKETEISGTVREMVNEAAASADRLYLPVQYKIRTAEQAYTKDGRLKKDGVVAGINECGAPPALQVATKGVQLPIEVFKTEGKGWGLRSPVKIKRGSFVCEYAGVMISEDEADSVDSDKGEDAYFFIFDHYQHLVNNLCSNESRRRRCLAIKFEPPTVDAQHSGNVGRFINTVLPGAGTDDGNLVIQVVITDKIHSTIFYKICFFAVKDIEAMTELLYDYGYHHNEVQPSWAAAEPSTHANYMAHPSGPAKAQPELATAEYAHQTPVEIAAQADGGFAGQSDEAAAKYGDTPSGSTLSLQSGGVSLRGVSQTSRCLWDARVELRHVNGASMVISLPEQNTPVLAAHTYDMALLLIPASQRPPSAKLNFAFAQYEGWLYRNGYIVASVAHVSTDPQHSLRGSIGKQEEQLWEAVHAALQRLSLLTARIVPSSCGRPLPKETAADAAGAGPSGLHRPASVPSPVQDKCKFLGVQKGHKPGVWLSRLSYKQKGNWTQINLGTYPNLVEPACVADMARLLCKQCGEKSKLNFHITFYSEWLQQHGYSVPAMPCTSPEDTPTDMSDAIVNRLWEFVESKLSKASALKPKRSAGGVRSAPDAGPTSDMRMPATAADGAPRSADGGAAGSEQGVPCEWEEMDNGCAEGSDGAMDISPSNMVSADGENPASEGVPQSFRGVTYRPTSKQWRADLEISDGIGRFIGYYATQEEAAREWDKAALLWEGLGNVVTNFDYTDYYPPLRRVPSGATGPHQVSRPESLGHLGVHWGVDVPAIFDEHAVGREVCIYHQQDREMYRAVVHRFEGRTGLYKVQYRGGLLDEWLLLWNEQVEWRRGSGDGGGSSGVSQTWETEWEAGEGGVSRGTRVKARINGASCAGTVTRRVRATLRMGRWEGMAMQEYRYWVEYEEVRREVLSADEVASMSLEVQEAGDSPNNKRRKLS